MTPPSSSVSTYAHRDAARSSDPSHFELPHPDRGWSRKMFTRTNAAIWPAGDLRPRPVCGVTEAEASIRDFHKFTGGKMVFLPIGEPIDVALRNAF